MRRTPIAMAAAAILLLGSIGTGAAPASASPSRVAASATASVRLLTGETVTTTTLHGRTTSTIHPVPGRAEALVRVTEGSHRYVIPTAALHYLGTQLDPSLFDIGELRPGVPVHVSASRPSAVHVPGLRVTGRSATSLTGTFDAAGSRAFGSALAAQATKDAQSRTTSGTLFGATRLSLSASGASTVRPTFAQKTLRIRVLDHRGRPADAVVSLMNTDDPAKSTVGLLPAIGGEARVSVPTGHYTAYATVADESSIRAVVIPDFTVTSNMQVTTLDARTATARLSLTTPRPTDPQQSGLSWDWTRMAQHGDFFGVLLSGITAFGGIDTYVSPTGATKYGTTTTSSVFRYPGRQGRGAPYAYTAGFAEQSSISSHQAHTIRAVATVQTIGYPVSPTSQSAVAYSPQLDGFGGFAVSLAMPPSGQLTNYLAAAPGVTWSADYTPDITSDRPLEVVDASRARVAGHSYQDRFLNGPLSAGVPQPPDGSTFFICSVCRAGGFLYAAVAPATDSVAGHYAMLATDPEQPGPQIQQSTLWLNGVEVGSDASGDGFQVRPPAGVTTARLRTETWLRRLGFTRSTHSVTDLTFHSSASDPAHDDYICGSLGSDECQVPDVLTANVALPTTTSSTMSPGSHLTQFTIAPLVGGRPATVTASFALSFDGGKTFTTVPVTSLGSNRFQVALVNPAGAAGKSVSVRISGRSSSGALLTQTTDAAYVVSKA